MDYSPKPGPQKYSSVDAYEIPDSRSELISTSFYKKTSEPFTFNSDNIDDLKAGTANILVAVRCRPLSQKETSLSDVETIGIVESRVVVLKEPPNDNDPRESSRGPKREKNFTFDHFFDQKVSNLAIFERCTKNLIPGVTQGYNGTVFAYGATGAGKTYTMMGSTNNPGIMSFTLQELFTQIAAKQELKKLVVKISFLEVYNETIIDLLGEKNSNLDIREDAERGVYIQGITEYTANSEEEVMRYLKIGTKNRTMEATSANEVSSRSHAILQVSIESKSRTEGNSQEINYSKLSLIDLAGSERAATTKNTGIRLTEGANINKSLLALSNCITILVEKLDKGLKSIYIPYRDSKLTRLLKDSLGGNCRTVMIANVSPSAISYDDTNNTLKFADKAKKIKTNLKKKVVMIESEHDKYTRIINNLQAENENLRKLLKEQQMNNTLYSTIGPRQYSSNSGTLFDAPPPFRSPEAMTQEIQSHFEHEMKANKKLFDLELIHDEYFLKIKEITQELGKQENMELRDELSHLITFQRNVLLQLKTARQESEIMSGNRDKLLKKISDEANKSLIDNGLAIYNQLHSFLDDMKLEHQEKRIKYQTKLNGTQQDFIRSQMTGFFHHAPQTISQQFFSRERERTTSTDNFRNQSPLDTEKFRVRNYEQPVRQTLTPPPISRRSPSQSPDFKSFNRPQLTDRSRKKNLINTLKPTPPITRPKSKNTVTKKAPPKSSGGLSSNNNPYFFREKFLQERFKPFEPQNKPQKPKRPGGKTPIEGRKSRTPLESHSNNLEKEFEVGNGKDFDCSMELIGPPINYNNLIAKISMGNTQKMMNHRSTSDNSEMNYSSNDVKSRLPQIGNKSPTKVGQIKYEY